MNVTKRRVAAAGALAVALVLQACASTPAADTDEATRLPKQAQVEVPQLPLPPEPLALLRVRPDKMQAYNPCADVFAADFFLPYCSPAAQTEGHWSKYEPCVDRSSAPSDGEQTAGTDLPPDASADAPQRASGVEAGLSRLLALPARPDGCWSELFEPSDDAPTLPGIAADPHIYIVPSALRNTTLLRHLDELRPTMTLEEFGRGLGVRLLVRSDDAEALASAISAHCEASDEHCPGLVSVSAHPHFVSIDRLTGRYDDGAVDTYRDALESAQYDPAAYFQRMTPALASFLEDDSAALSVYLRLDHYWSLMALSEATTWGRWLDRLPPHTYNSGAIGRLGNVASAVVFESEERRHFEDLAVSLHTTAAGGLDVALTRTLTELGRRSRGEVAPLPSVTLARANARFEFARHFRPTSGEPPRYVTLARHGLGSHVRPDAWRKFVAWLEDPFAARSISAVYGHKQRRRMTDNASILTPDTTSRWSAVQAIRGAFHLPAADEPFRALVVLRADPGSDLDAAVGLIVRLAKSMGQGASYQAQRGEDSLEVRLEINSDLAGIGDAEPVESFGLWFDGDDRQVTPIDFSEPDRSSSSPTDQVLFESINAAIESGRARARRQHTDVAERLSISLGEPIDHERREPRGWTDFEPAAVPARGPCRNRFDYRSLRAMREHTQRLDFKHMYQFLPSLALMSRDCDDEVVSKGLESWTAWTGHALEQVYAASAATVMFGRACELGHEGACAAAERLSSSPADLELPTDDSMRERSVRIPNGALTSRGFVVRDKPPVPLEDLFSPDGPEVPQAQTSSSNLSLALDLATPGAILREALVWVLAQEFYEPGMTRDDVEKALAKRERMGWAVHILTRTAPAEDEVFAFGSIVSSTTPGTPRRRPDTVVEIDIDEAGIDVVFGGEKVAPIDGCDPDGPTVCTSRPAGEVLASSRHAWSALVDGDPAGARKAARETAAAYPLDKFDDVMADIAEKSRVEGGPGRRPSIEGSAEISIGDHVPLAVLAPVLAIVEYERETTLGRKQRRFWPAHLEVR